jgi:CheY-like chemotaxis protein
MVKTALIVDDNAFVRRALRQLLTRELAVEVYEAENGKEAIEKAQELRPDLIVLDLSMPVMNGLEAARAIKSVMPTVPLIMYSAFLNPFAKEEARSIGIAELVSKSEHASVLIRKARRLLYQTAA